MQGGVTLTDGTQKTVLVLEDQPLIALEVEDLLNRAGFFNVITFTSCGDAELWLEAHTPDLAVIETRLRDGSSDSVAKCLAGNNVPIIVHSADEAHFDPATELTRLSHIWINKPCLPENFLTAINECRPADRNR